MQKSQKEKAYIAVKVSRTLGERKIAGFGACDDRDARRKFQKWFPNGDGFLKYKLYKLVDYSK